MQLKRDCRVFHATIKGSCKATFTSEDNLLMEESAQILEVETFIPMLLQNAESGVSRIQRALRCVRTTGLVGVLLLKSSVSRF